MSVLGPDRRGRPGAECGCSGPTTGTRADGPEENPHHTWRNAQMSGQEAEGKESAEGGQRNVFGLTSVSERVKGVICWCGQDIPVPYPS